MADFMQDLVRAASAEWEFFGNTQYRLDRTRIFGKREYEDGAYQRIHDYWRNIGGAYANLTGKDRGYPWSAAFISFCMREAGAKSRFRYSAGHAAYINDAIRAGSQNQKSALFHARNKKGYKVKEGDLVGYWRGDRPITLKNALKIGWYKSHTDIVVDVDKKSIQVIGGNVGDSVTRKELRINSKGELTDTQYPWFVVMENRG